ncbi:MAG TPA: tetratricopeptide repeat protein [Acidobacteriaceae bacterium]|nr:tetratricopeptide repeat protein [Acidobacteriaceae bacterium]
MPPFRLVVCCGALLLLPAPKSQAQLPPSCKAPASAANPPAGTPPARVYDAVGVWFAQKGDLKCSVAAFNQALRLEPHSAEAHFDLGLVRQQQEENDAAIHEFQAALQYDPGLLQARCALGSVLPNAADAEAEFRKALAANPQLVCALDGLAQVLLNGGRYDAALDYWRQAVRIQPDAPDLQFALATATYKAAKARQDDGLPPLEGSTIADAIHLFTELLSKHPEMTAAHFTLGNIFANEHRFREAADEYRAVVRQDATNTVALAAEIKALVDVTAYTDALAPALDYVRQKPNDPSGHVLLGMVYRGLGEYAKAEPELELGAARAPDDFEARYQLGFVLARLGKPDQALPQLRKAVALNPTDKSAQFQLAAVLRTLGQNEEAGKIVEQFQKTTDTEFRKSQLTSDGIKANDLLQAGKPAEAAQIYRHMLEANPNSAWTAYNLALALEETNDLNGAEDALRKGTEIDPKIAKIRAELGQLKLSEGDLESAQQWLQSALDLEPQLAGARGNLAMIYARKGDLATAEKLIRQSLEDDPQYKEGHLNLGLILAQQDKLIPAEQELERAAALAPEDPNILSTVGKAEAQMGKMTDGIAHLRKVVALRPDLAAAHLDLALALADSYNLPAALEETNTAVRLAPQSGVVHFYRGRILYDLGRTAEAQPEFETAVQLVPKMPEPRYFLALINKQEGKFSAASGLLEETVKLQPRNVMAWYLLGQCLEQQSETDKAVAAWRQAIAIDPNFSQALFNLAHALRSSDPAESGKYMAHYVEIQKQRHILDNAGTLANNGVIAASAHDWPEATRQVKAAIAECGDCAVKADLHKKLGLIDCQAGDLKNGEKELLAAQALTPTDPEIESALKLIADAKNQHTASAGKANE